MLSNGLRRVERRLPQPSHQTYDIAVLRDTAEFNMRWPVASSVSQRRAAMCRAQAQKDVRNSRAWLAEAASWTSKAERKLHPTSKNATLLAQLVQKKTA
jgi:hypothetical protein